MKKLIFALIATSLFSCKKSTDLEPEKGVEYRFECEQCYIEIDSKNKTTVSEFYVYGTINENAETNILVSGKGKITTTVKNNGKTVFNKTDENGYFKYNIKLK